MFTNIKSVLPRRIDSLGIKEKMAEQNIVKIAQAILAKKILKDNNENVVVVAYVKKKLIVAAKNPQWAAKTFIFKEQLKDELEAVLSKIDIEDIRIVIGGERKRSAPQRSRRGRKHGS